MLYKCFVFAGYAIKIKNTQQTQGVESMLVSRWSNVVDGGPTLDQPWFNVLCLLGMEKMNWGQQKKFN